MVAMALSGSIAFVIVSLMAATHVSAQGSQPNDNRVDFQRDIQPIFQSHCYKCHGPDEQEGQLRLDARQFVFGASVSGPLVIAGSAPTSRLFQRVAGLGDDEQMPPDGPLSDKQIELIKRWIDQGALWPVGAAGEANVQKHWAYVVPRRPPLPKVALSDWVANPIDHFVLARLEQSGLQPSPMEASARLLRRVYLDLIGLPPSVAEVDAFLADQRSDAYERNVDRLLESEHFGERWAVPWLDAARYADSNGYQADQYREVWPYRDWVVRAINADMPFDQFTIEQIAGDLLPDATMEQRIATGFHRQTTCNVEAGVDPEENRVNQVFDRVNTTGMVWLGTTLECAQCHNHKYDPFSQRDYYRLFAYFNNTPIEVKHTTKTTFDFYGPKLNVPLPENATEHQRRLKQQLIATRAQLSNLVDRLVEQQPAWEAGQLRRITDFQSDDDWAVASVIDFQSTAGASHQVLADQSVLVSGKRPDSDTYQVLADSAFSKITAIKLEALTHPALLGQGPGRHHVDRPNFVLNQFQASIESADGKSRRPLKLTSAWADYSHANYDVRKAIDGVDSTGWAIHQEFHKPHTAIFYLQEPALISSNGRLFVTLRQNHGGCKTIGRMRISVCQDDPPPKSARVDTSLPPELSEILMVPAANRTEDQQAELMEFYHRQHAEFRQLNQNINLLTKELGETLSATTLVMTRQGSKRESFMLERGDFRSPLEKVTAGTPRVLHAPMDNAPPDRLSFAQWLTSHDNPLTARVIINRWWTQIFGRGIVATPEDFGTQGDRPTHPEMLDWLAVEFIEGGWSRKKMLKLMVMSSTYRQSSRTSAHLRQVDPENKLLARAARFRLGAELIRDNALSISGLLSRKMGGPPVYPPQPAGVWRHVGRNAPKYETNTGDDRFRRGLYVIWRRSAPYPSFVNFDAPDRAACVINRTRANTPLQALTLLNDQAYVEMSWAFARRISQLPADSNREKIVFAFRSCVARYPQESEANLLLKTYDTELNRLRANPRKAAMLVGENEVVPDGVTIEQYAAWFFVANILLNLDETITKN